jgi:hypothetical protein
MTNNKQQTAVDSIIELCQKQMDNDSSIHKGVYLSIIKFCQEQAKEMEKEKTIRFALFYAYGQDNVSEQLRTKIEKWYDKIYEGGEQ